MSSTQDIPSPGVEEPDLRDPGTITDLGDLIDSMTAEARGYLATERAYITLLLSKRAADVTGAVVGGLVSLVLVGALVLFASLAGAVALGRVFGDPALGYLAVAGTYAILFIVFLALWRGSLGGRFKLRIIDPLDGH